MHIIGFFPSFARIKEIVDRGRDAMGARGEVRRIQARGSRILSASRHMVSKNRTPLIWREGTKNGNLHILHSEQENRIGFAQKMRVQAHRVAALLVVCSAPCLGAAHVEWHAHDLSASSVDLTPRLILSAACSGSSFVARQASALLQAHGLPMVIGGLYPDGTSIGDSEMLESKNPYLQANNGSMARAIDNLFRVTQSRGMAPLIKATQEVPDEVVSVLARYGTRAAVVLRENTLDRFLCHVDDCFVVPGDVCSYPDHSCAPWVGYVVNVSSADKAVSDACFDRRQLPREQQALLRVRVDTREEAGACRALHATEAESSHLHQQSSAALRAPAPRSYEELAAFEYDAEAADGSSFLAWSDLLGNALGVAVDASMLREQLRSGFDGLERSPLPHATRLVDPEGVRQMLGRCSPGMAPMWRD